MLAPTLVVAAAVGAAACWALQGLLAADTGYWLRTPLEKQLLLYSEQAFYYSFYQEVATAEKAEKAVWQTLLQNNRTEHPATIAALARFNLWPEVLVALARRVCGSPWGFTNPQDDMMVVLTALAGLQWAGFFACAGLALESLPAAGFAVLLVMGHADLATRLTSHPMLRENFALPFLWWQSLALAQMLKAKDRAAGRGWRRLCLACTVALLCCWQFSPSLLLLQLVAVFGLYCCAAVPLEALWGVLQCHMLAAGLGALCMGFNTMITGSLWLAALAALATVLSLLPSDGVLLHNVAQGIVVVPVSFAYKTLAGSLLLGTDDAHIGNIVRAHLFGFEDLMTALYLCGPTYSPMPWAQFWALGPPLLLPALVVAAVVALWSLAATANPQPVAVPLQFLTLQAVLFTALGLAIRRLSVVMIPSLALLAGALFSPVTWMLLATLPARAAESLGLIEGRKPSSPMRASRRLAGVLAGVGLVVVAGLMQTPPVSTFIADARFAVANPENVFRDPETAKLMRFLNRSLPVDTVVASDPVLSSMIKLTTRRPIVLHPQVEDALMRRRYVLFFQLFNRITEAQAALVLQRLNASVAVLADGPCHLRCGPDRKGLDYYASLPNEDGEVLFQVTESRPQFCAWVRQAKENLRLFDVLYSSGPFVVLQRRAP